MKLEPTQSKFTLKFYHVLYVVSLILGAFSIYASYSFTGRLWQPLINVLIGFVGMIVFSHINYRNLTRFASLGFLAALVLLIVTLIVGRGGGGRSLELGAISIQTFYIATFLCIFYMSAFLASCLRKKDELEKRDVVTILIFFTIIIGMIALRNISTAILLTVTGLSVLFVAGVRFKYLFIYVMVMMVCGAGYIFLRPSHNDAKADETELSEKHSDRGETGFNRLTYWVTGKSDKQGYGMQMTLAKTAIARSVLPKGPGKGVIKESMPERENDYVFAMLCEELSIGIGGFIAILYFIIFYQSLLISRKAKGNFVRFLSVGIGMLIVGQAFTHIGVNVGVLPSTGQTLPFISRGFTNLLVTCFAVGILINMGKNVAEKSDGTDEELSL